MAFIGRISPEKGVDAAIQIDKKVGIKLKIAAKVSQKDQAYFDSEIRHLLNDPIIEFVGEIGEIEKGDFLGNAMAMLFPIDWPEPFGMVIIESFACGTPVIAYNHGSVPEIINDGKTGFIVESIDQALQAVNKIDKIKRKNCREEFETRFNVERMCKDYLNVYSQLIKR